MMRWLPWVMIAAFCGCNAIFGINGGQLGTGGAGAAGPTSTSGAPASGSSSSTSGTGGAVTAGPTSASGSSSGGASTGGNSTGGSSTGGSMGSTSSTSTGTGGGACAADRTPPCNAVGGVCTPQVLDATQPVAYDVLVSGDLVYYSTTGNTLRMLRYDGSGANTFTTSWPTYALAADSSNLYITDYYQEIH